LKDDLELLQGLWNVTALEVEGQTMPAAMLANATIVIKGTRFTSNGMGAVYEGILKLDAASTPRQLDMEFDAGPEKGNTNLGIYELKRDKWTICLATRGTVRPAAFASLPGSGFALESLTRGKARVQKMEAPVKTDSAPATEFEGEWQMISGTMNGEPMSQSDVQWVKRVTHGNQTTVYAGPQVMMAMQFTSDASKKPGNIDYFNTAGSNKGKNQEGIYEFEGDLLKVCVSAPGSPRPAQFESAPGDRRTLTTWKRI